MAKLKGQAKRGEERRADIVDAAIEVFATRGFRGTALAEVAERVGVSAANVLYHFGSKEELLLAVIAERDRRAGIQIEQLLPAREGLRSLRDAALFAAQSEREPGLTALHPVLQIESLDEKHPAHRYFQVRSRVLRDWVADSLRAAKRRGEVREDVDVKRVAAQVVAFIEGAAVLWLVDPAQSLVDLYRDYFEGL